ncbi:3',5'-cyclic-nucleotide phosphodiesterase [Helicobacter aurati]|uniref:3',5'-cyclic-nucleotide phosphodiesterase n=1 Tax=Helicobacter aurati TaxID=137778 RepID=A0A3D8J5M4_9HELI|nr:3',5'-cyclic-nucleotide phosphodiesterase [Helicobacter aurati]RDU72550.1 3',5'-cyclic-nucleotide phosphodiesterase [Helicobacter aurati]
MKVFHLSHIDLDGYGCQLVSREFFQDITFYNANYGREVAVRLNTILNAISSYKKTTASTAMIFGKPVPIHVDTSDTLDSKQKFIILITDLNLTPSESKFLNEQVAALKLAQLDVEVILLDHHATGEESAETYNWYYLDVSRCATKITYEYFLNRFGLESHVQKWLKPMVEMINSVDIWLEDGFGFEFGKVAMSMIATSNEINRFMFDKEHREYKLDLLQRASHFLRKCNSNKAGGLIDGMAFDEVDFDNELFFLKKAALGGDRNKETMDNIVSRALVKLLEEKKETCKVFYEDRMGFLSYCMGGISVVANRFLHNNAEFDFYIDVSNRGNVSLRSNGKCDVSMLSQACFNGGGHKNASGGRMDGFKESFLYDDIKSQVQEFLEMRDEWNL